MNTNRLVQFRYPLCAFLLLFFFASPVWAQEFEPNAEQKKFMEEQLQETKDRLQLTDEQQVAVEEILMGSYQEREALKEKYGMNPMDPDFKRPKRKTAKSFRSDMESLNQETAKQLAEHLTTEQMDTWKALEQERADFLRDQIRNN